MRRRDFLLTGLATAGAPFSRPASGQPAPKRAAVVIGVDKAGGLPPLRAARSGARKVSAWLRGEGFDVHLLVDESGPVRAGDIFDAVNGLVSRGTLEQLVVYFAGHGCINSYAEYWLLSNAPDNPNEAVSLTESVDLARRCGIPNVVFISDACRSRADSLRAERVRGSLVFPNTGGSTLVPEVDQFLATLVGDPAWEASVDQSVADFEGIYTLCFLEAYSRPDGDMVRTLAGAQVVPNRRLKRYLAREVPKRAQAVSVRLRQNPDSRIESDEDTYIGRIRTAERAPASAPSAARSTLVDLAGAELRAAGAGDLAGTLPTRPSDSAVFRSRTGFDRNRNAIFAARGLDRQLSAMTGFAVTGARLAAVVAHRAWGTDFHNASASARPAALAEVDLSGAPAASVALQFADGTGTVIAALNGFIASVLVDERGVLSVTYAPSRRSSMRSMYDAEERRIAELHATVATAARFGVFRIEGDRSARNSAASDLADRIRMFKGVDPTLGLYAAYAYADAGIAGSVQSVRGIMRNDLDVDLFDIAMLAGALSRGRAAPRTYPFCPMLSQGWSLLRVREVRLPDGVAAAGDHLRPSLWTTLDAGGMEIVTAALEQDRVR